MDKLKIYIKKYISFVLIAILFLSLGCFLEKKSNTSPFDSDSKKIIKVSDEDLEENGKESREDDLKIAKEEKITIYVHIAGAVKKPGVYEMQDGDRVIQAVEKAFPKDEAEVNGLNLAEKLTDGEKIVVPNKKDATLAHDVSNVASNLEKTTKISLNKASKEELKTLSGVGDKRAEDIISYRESHGGFKKLEELKEVGGIGEKTYEKLKDEIIL